MTTQRELEIREVWGKDIFEMTTKELHENGLAEDWFKIVEEHAEWQREQEEED